MGNPEEGKRAKFLNTLKLLTVEPYMFLALFGYVVRLVSYQDLLMDRSCRNTFGYSDEICNNINDHKTEQRNSIEMGNNLYTGVMLLNSIPAVIVVIFVGPWSDKYTRRWPLIISVAGMLAESVATTFLTINNHVSPIYFVLVSLLSGVSGGYMAATSSVASYLSDVTTPKSRASRFAVLDFFTISAMLFGNVIGGQIFKSYGYLAVVSVAPFFHLSALLYAIFVLKDTKPPIDSDKMKDMFKDLVTLENIKQSYRTCTRKRYGNIRLQIWLLVWIDTSYRFVQMGTLAIGYAFAKRMYTMGVTEYSNVSTIFSSIQAVMTIAAVPLLSKKLCLHEAAIGLIGMLSLIAKMVLLSVAFYIPFFYYGMFSGALGTTIAIAVRSRMSKLVSKEELGRAFALLGIFGSTSPMVGTTVFFQIYNASLDSFPGLTYASAAIFLAPCVIIFLWMTSLPTVSVGDYGKEEGTTLETVSSKYETLEEEGI